jgi:hypothetical protein
MFATPHAGAHVGAWQPRLHIGVPPPQCMPQVPQLSGSFARFTQAPLQHESPTLHAPPSQGPPPLSAVSVRASRLGAQQCVEQTPEPGGGLGQVRLPGSPVKPDGHPPHKHMPPAGAHVSSFAASLVGPPSRIPLSAEFKGVPALHPTKSTAKTEKPRIRAAYAPDGFARKKA